MVNENTSIEEIKALLLELTAVPAVSGMEQALVRVLLEKFKPLADEVSVDAFGNLFAVRHGPEGSPRLMISAHSDEVGGVVTAITPEGFLRFRPVGVIDPNILPATRVMVDQRLPGMVVCVPGHSGTNTAQNGGLNRELFVDVGASGSEEAEDWGLHIGVGIAFESPVVSLKNPRLVMGKSLDNRIGCTELLKLFERIQGVRIPVTLYGVVTVQEEIGMRGARMAAARVSPDYAIALDTVPLDDAPTHCMPDAPYAIGHGPVIQLWEGKAEQFLGTVAHPGVTDLIFRTAEMLNISLQRSAAYGMWVTDGAAIHVSGEGIPTGFISTPRRYGHTPNEVLDLADAQAAIHLLTAIVSKTGADFKPSFI
jgi:putative aminopeptidase